MQNQCKHELLSTLKWKLLNMSNKCYIVLSLLYYSTIAPFYINWSRQQEKYESAMHRECSGLIGLQHSSYGQKAVQQNGLQSNEPNIEMFEVRPLRLTF